MAELYVKPGNQEKGWNDPPQFSYGLQNQGSGSKRPPLTKRVPVPLEGTPPVPPPQSFVSPTPPKMPAISITTPLGPPPAGQTYSSPRIEVVKHPTSLSEDECSIGAEDVLGPLNHVLNCCRDAVRKQVCDDISRRLTTLEQMWKTGKLSPSVKKRMSILVRELQAHNWDVADEIHRSLMVDHVNEVSQWMVGVKRLIAEVRNLPPETLALHKEEATPRQNLEAAQ